jgi:hypothetical protein
MNDTQTIPNPDSTQPYAHGFTGGGSDNYTGTAHGDWAHDQSGWSNNQADWSGNNNWDGTRAAEWTPPTPEPAKPKGQFAIGFGLTLVLAAILLGAVHFGYLEQGSVALSLVVSIAIILGGLMVIVNGLRGRPSGGAGFFSVMALITALFFGITGVAGANFKAQNFTGISSQSLTPQSIAEIEGGFSFGVGDLVLDLTQIPLSEFAERDEPLEEFARRRRVHRPAPDQEQSRGWQPELQPREQFRPDRRPRGQRQHQPRSGKHQHQWRI